MHLLVSFFSGLLFGLGLIISAMVNPDKVLAFLDLAGNWDPSLAFVMAGAIAVSGIAFRLAGKRTKSLLGDQMRLPSAGDIDRRLVLGAAVFGVGWGMAGFCPGPALAALGTGNGKAYVFVLAMLAGMALYEVIERMSFHHAPAE